MFLLIFLLKHPLDMFQSVLPLPKWHPTCMAKEVCKILSCMPKEVGKILFHHACKKKEGKKKSNSLRLYHSSLARIKIGLFSSGRDDLLLFVIVHTTVEFVVI